MSLPCNLCSGVLTNWNRSFGEEERLLLWFLGGECKMDIRPLEKVDLNSLRGLLFTLRLLWQADGEKKC